MQRALRIEHPGAIYHVMNRGDRRAQKDDEEFKPIRRRWCLGHETFRKELLESVHLRATEGHHAKTRR